MDQLAPTTELEAVNDMLSAIGESAVAAIDETQPDAQLAVTILRRESRKVQARGWHWNTDENCKLLPDINGEITLPIGTLKVDTVGESSGLDLTNRQGKLYDRVNQTFALSKSVYVDLTTLQDFETIPESARTYISVRAGRIFLQRTVGRNDSIGYEAKDEQEALAALEADEESSADRTIFSNPEYARLMHYRRPTQWP